MKKYIKPNLFFLFLTIVIVTSCSENQEKNENKIFLDFYLGMPEEEFNAQLDTLQKSNVIYRKGYPRNTYYYDFELYGGEKETVEIDEYIKNGELRSLELEFGYFAGSGLGNRNGFSDFCKLSDIRQVYSLYVEKYGNPAKRDEANDRVWVWKNGNIEITFNLGEEAGAAKTYTTGAYIEYEFNWEYQQKRDEQKFNKTRKDTKDQI